ncbi:MAG: Lrp/AsnC family transcriptional regulator [Acidobacteriota bacterium]|nr:Lrp/AsnC family transcriptional regulator [Acidobacteriota bacterium]
MINEIDTKILNIIQKDARIANAEIARQVGLAPSAVLERIRKLEERGVIRGYAAEIDAAQIGFGLTAFVFVRTSFCGSIGSVLAKIPEVLEVHDIAGDDCYLLKVRAENTDALGKFFREKLKNLPEIISTKTTIVLQTIKETTALPIEETASSKEESPAKPKAKPSAKSKRNLKKQGD